LSCAIEPYFSVFIGGIGPCLDKLKTLNFGGKLYTKLLLAYPELNSYIHKSKPKKQIIQRNAGNLNSFQGGNQYIPQNMINVNNNLANNNIVNNINNIKTINTMYNQQKPIYMDQTQMKMNNKMSNFQMESQQQSAYNYTKNKQGQEQFNPYYNQKFY
jgi:hypothetical protein